MRNMKTNQQVAIEVLMGKWGNGTERRTRLTNAGYDYNAIQSIVSCLVIDGTFPNDEKEVAITGEETLEIDIDISKYNTISVRLLNSKAEEN